MSNEATAQRQEPQRFVCDTRACVDGGDSCKAQMSECIAGAFVYHSDYAQLLAEVGRLRTMVERNARDSHAALHVGGIAGGPRFEDCKERLCVDARARRKERR